MRSKVQVPPPWATRGLSRVGRAVSGLDPRGPGAVLRAGASPDSEHRGTQIGGQTEYHVS